MRSAKISVLFSLQTRLKILTSRGNKTGLIRMVTLKSRNPPAAALGSRQILALHHANTHNDKRWKGVLLSRWNENRYRNVGQSNVVLLCPWTGQMAVRQTNNLFEATSQGCATTCPPIAHESGFPNYVHPKAQRPRILRMSSLLSLPCCFCIDSALEVAQHNSACLHSKVAQV